MNTKIFESIFMFKYILAPSILNGSKSLYNAIPLKIPINPINQFKSAPTHNLPASKY